MGPISSFLVDQIEPVSSFLLGHMTGHTLDRFTGAVRQRVLEPLSRRRAKQFFDQFCSEHFGSGIPPSPDLLNKAIDDLLSDPVRCEVMYEACRAVSATRSKDTGPRVIAIVTARAIAAGRELSSIEEDVVWAAETLTDEEFSEMEEFTADQVTRAANPTAKDYSWERDSSLKIRWHKEQIDSNWRRNHDVSLGSLNLGADYGRWVYKLQGRGLLREDITETGWDYREDSERHIDEPGSVRQFTWWLTLAPSTIELARLIKLVTVPTSNEGTGEFEPPAA